MLIEKARVTVYDLENKNRKKIEETLATFEYERYFRHIVCINMACFKKHGQKILSELEFLNGKENLFIFYEKLNTGEEYDGDLKVKFVKELGFHCTSNCLCVGAPQTQTIEDAIEDSLRKAHFIE